MFYWNENFDYALMDILKNTRIHHWSMLCHCLALLAIEILLKNKLEIIFNIYNFF